MLRLNGEWTPWTPPPFGLSLSKPCSALRQAQRERVGGMGRHGVLASTSSARTGVGVRRSRQYLSTSAPHFKLIVVFTPWLLVLSSNHRAVTVLVWV